MAEKVLDRNNAIGLLDLNGQDFYVKDTLQMIYPSAYRPSGGHSWIEFKGSGVCEKAFDRKNVVGLWALNGKHFHIKDTLSGKTDFWTILLTEGEYRDRGLLSEHEQTCIEKQVRMWNDEEEAQARMPVLTPRQRKDLGSILLEWRASTYRRKDTLSPKYHVMLV